MQIIAKNFAYFKKILYLCAQIVFCLYERSNNEEIIGHYY